MNLASFTETRRVMARRMAAVLMLGSLLLGIAATPAHASSNEECSPVFGEIVLGNNISVCVAWWWESRNDNPTHLVISMTAYFGPNFHTTADRCTVSFSGQASTTSTTWNLPGRSGNCYTNMRNGTDYYFSALESDTIATAFRPTVTVVIGWGPTTHNTYPHTFGWIGRADGCCD